MFLTLSYGNNVILLKILQNRTYSKLFQYNYWKFGSTGIFSDFLTKLTQLLGSTEQQKNIFFP